VTPSNPQDPAKGKPFEEEQAAQDAKDAATETAKAKSEEPAEKKPAAKKPRKKAEPKAAQAEGTAAEETGVDKAGAEAAAVSEPEPEPKPKKKPAAKKPAPKKEEEVAKPAAPAPAPSRSRRRRNQPGERVIVRAQAKYVRSSPRKSRLVCDGIRGKTVAEARSILAFHPRAVAEAWSKLLESAVANAENNHDLVGEDLKIHAVFADAGPTIKRFRPRAMGRATRIRKRTSHLTIQLTPKDS
jgi:ribosomal protein L22